MRLVSLVTCLSGIREWSGGVFSLISQPYAWCTRSDGSDSGSRACSEFDLLTPFLLVLPLSRGPEHVTEIPSTWKGRKQQVAHQNVPRCGSLSSLVHNSVLLQNLYIAGQEFYYARWLINILGKGLMCFCILTAVCSVISNNKFMLVVTIFCVIPM